MKRIYGSQDGYCEICYESKPTVMFEEEMTGYGGWYLVFEICEKCFLEKLKPKGK